MQNNLIKSKIHLYLQLYYYVQACKMQNRFFQKNESIQNIDRKSLEGWQEFNIFKNTIDVFVQNLFLTLP